MVYLSTAQQIFQTQYNLKEQFPYIFAGLSVAIGSATLLNATLVLKYGMEKMVTAAMALLILVYLKVSGNPQILKKMSFKSV